MGNLNTTWPQSVMASQSEKVRVIRSLIESVMPVIGTLRGFSRIRQMTGPKWSSTFLNWCNYKWKNEILLNAFVLVYSLYFHIPLAHKGNIWAFQLEAFSYHLIQIFRCQSAILIKFLIVRVNGLSFTSCILISVYREGGYKVKISHAYLRRVLVRFDI